MRSAQNPHTSATPVVRAIPVVVVLLLALLGTANTPAHAASTRISQPRATRTVAMNIDCSRVPNTPLAKATLKKQHLCEYGTDTGTGVSPYYAHADGNCGSLVLDPTQGYPSGHLVWKVDITSTQGPFTFASYGGYWQLWPNPQNNLTRTLWIAWTTAWYDEIGIDTGVGTVFVTVTSAIDQLWWGGICTGGPLYDSLYLS